MSEEGLHFRELTRENIGDVLIVEVSPEQRRFVASAARSIAMAHFYEEEAWHRAIYDDDTPIGYFLLWINKKEPRHYLGRFLIGTDHQGKGHGRRAVELLISHVKTLDGATDLVLSHVPGEGSPAGFYEKLGFAYTGRTVHGELEMTLPLTE